MDPISSRDPDLPKDSGKESNSLSAGAEPFKSAGQLSVFAQEFVPKTIVAAAPPPQPYQQQYGETEYYEPESAGQGAGDPLLDYAFQVLYEITYSPGHFNHLCQQLISNLNSWPSLDESMLEILVDEIVALVINQLLNCQMK